MMRKLLLSAGLLGVVFGCGAAGADAMEGWSPKFYNGLEAAGDMTVDPTGFQGREPAIRLTWASGMPKFGASKSFPSTVKGVQDWMVSAQVWCATGGAVKVAIEFFDDLGQTLGLQEGVSRSFPTWTPVTWKFTSPRKAVKADIHLLSLTEKPVAFARVAVASIPGIDRGDSSFAMKVLPPEWNRDWNGGRTRMLNFSDAPLPMAVLLRGDPRELKSPWFEVDFPDELELKDSFCPKLECGGRETPVSVTPFERDGRPYVRVRFEKLRYFPKMDRASFADGAGGILLVLGPKAGGERLEKTFPVVCRIADGEKTVEERIVEMEFRPMPTGLRTAKDFFAFAWQSDRCFADDTALAAALNAYEAAGLRSFRTRAKAFAGEMMSRWKDIRALLEKRPVKYVFSASFGDFQTLSKSKLSKKQLQKMGGNMSVTSDKAGRRADMICPEFFTTDRKFRRHLEENAIIPALKAVGVKDGDWVTLDMEPWQSDTYCFCPRCLKAFAAFAGLDRVPTMEEARAMGDKWAEFRVRHGAKSVEIISEIVRRYNPTLKVFDYDYVVEYGDPESRASFIRRCAKDSALNETWLDGHLASYYHRIGKRSFDAIRNNVRHLKKTYIPMAGLSGYASWVRPGEVLNPRQVRQFALAAFVNGCSGYAFYPGVHFDGEVLLAMMEAQDLAARYEGLPWGKVDGRSPATSASEQFAYASTVRPDGTEVLALFNYDMESPISVSAAGRTVRLEPLAVEFIEVK